MWVGQAKVWSQSHTFDTRFNSVLGRERNLCDGAGFACLLQMLRDAQMPFQELKAQASMPQRRMSVTMTAYVRAINAIDINRTNNNNKQKSHRGLVAKYYINYIYFPALRPTSAKRVNVSPGCPFEVKVFFSTFFSFLSACMIEINKKRKGKNKQLSLTRSLAEIKQ